MPKVAHLEFAFLTGWVTLRCRPRDTRVRSLVWPGKGRGSCTHGWISSAYGTRPVILIPVTSAWEAPQIRSDYTKSPLLPLHMVQFNTRWVQTAVLTSQNRFPPFPWLPCGTLLLCLEVPPSPPNADPSAGIKAWPGPRTSGASGNLPSAWQAPGPPRSGSGPRER